MEPRTQVLRFDSFEVNVATGEVRHNGSRIRIQEQPFQVLVAMLERPGELVTRDELQKRLWPDGVIVDFDRGLNKAVNRLREALRDNADSPQFVETIPQRGYRFLGVVERPAAEPQVTAVDSSIGKQTRTLSRRSLLIGGGLVGLGTIPLITLFIQKRSDLERVQSIAVLPLANLSGDPEQEYFSEGMTDELIGGLARITSLRVTSRTSVMRFRGDKSRSLPSIARELGVDAIVEGTVTRYDGRVRITAQLIRARDDRHLWSETYDRELKDLLLLRSEVATAIANQIQIKLAESQKSDGSVKPNIDPRAYDAYLRGNFFLQQGIRGVLKSLDAFRQALTIDSSLLEAHVGLGEALCFAGIFGFRPSAETYMEARTSAGKALQIDSSSAGAHNILADVMKGYEWDLATAEKEYLRAIQLNPSHLLTRLWYAECLTRMKRFDSALHESDKAIALDPVSPISHNNRSMLLFRARLYDEAIEVSRQALDLEPSFVNALWWQGLAFAGKHQYQDALVALSKGLEMHDGPLFQSLLGFVYGCVSDRTRALQTVKTLTVLSKTTFVSPINFAIIHAGLGDADSAFQWLETAYRTRETRIHELPDLYFDSLRQDSRYADLGRRVGLP